MKDAKYINVMSKVSERTYARLTKICKQYQFRSNYEILQYLIGAFLRYADPGGEDEAGRQEAKEIAQIFADLDNVERRVITTRPTLEGKKLNQAICLYDIGRKKNALFRCIQYRADGISTTDRYDAPLRIIITAIYPRLASAIDGYMKKNSLLDYESALLSILGRIGKDRDISDDIRELFSEYSEGVLPEPGQQPKQHRDHAKKPSVS